MCLHNPGPMSCEMFIARAGALKIKGTMSHDEYWSIVERHFPNRPAKTTIEYHGDGKYIPKMFQKKEPSVPAMDENIYDGITIETKEDGVRNTVTVNGEVCTFDPRLVIKIGDEEDGLKFHEAFKRYINCEIGTDSLRRVAADPKHYDSYGDAIPAVPKIKNDDAVNHPSHYNQYKGLEIIQLTSQLNFDRGNSVKYVARAGYKSKDTEVQDLEKGLWYITYEVENYKEGQFVVPPWGDFDIMALVGQMNFFRGSAVLHIARAGRPNFRNNEFDDLEIGRNYIQDEINRLKDL